MKVVQGGGIAEVGAMPFAVYMVLRSFVWRSRDKGHPVLREEIEKGNLAAVLRQERIAQLVGVTDKTIQRATLVLEKAGWVKVTVKGRIRVYVLGRREGNREIYFADERGTSESTLDADEGGHLEPAKADIWSLQRRTFEAPSSIEDQREKDKGKLTPEARRIRKTKTPSPSRSDPKGSELILGTPQPPNRAGWAEPDRDAEPANGKAALVEDSKIEGRLLTPVEARQIQSARVKTGEGREREYSSAEIVAVWRAFFYRAFGGEDPDLATEAQRKRAAQSISRRANDWAGGDKATIRRYLGDMIRLWRDRPEKARFPTGAAPRLSSLLKRDKRGPSTFWRDWDLGRRKRRRDG